MFLAPRVWVNVNKCSKFFFILLCLSSRWSLEPPEPQSVSYQNPRATHTSPQHNVWVYLQPTGVAEVQVACRCRVFRRTQSNEYYNRHVPTCKTHLLLLPRL